MRESRTSGSVRGDRGNPVPYRYKRRGSVPRTAFDPYLPFVDDLTRTTCRPPAPSAAPRRAA
jgi:hypothetical protein